MNVVLVAVGVQTAKAPHRISFVGFKIGRAGVQLIGVLMNPWTGHIVLAGPQRRFIKAARFERRDDRVLRRPRGQNIVSIIANAVRDAVGLYRARLGLFGPSRRCKFQLQLVHDFLLRVAVVGLPYEKAALKRRAIYAGIFWLAVNRHRQAYPVAQGP